MEVEYTTRAIAVNDQLMSELEKLAKEGWQLVPGIQPVAIYNLVRPKGFVAQPAAVLAVPGNATLNIDDSKIAIYRNGKPIG